jgi:hypothetical protein
MSTSPPVVVSVLVMFAASICTYEVLVVEYVPDIRRYMSLSKVEVISSYRYCVLSLKYVFMSLDVKISLTHVLGVVHAIA